LLPSNACVEDANYILDYFRRTADGRLLYGGGIVYGGQDPASVEAKIRPGLVKTFPQLQDVKLDFAWSGTFAMTLSRMPQIGRLSPSIYYSHGDSGHGVTTTQLLGRLLAEAIGGQHARFDVFADLPHLPFPGGQRCARRSARWDRCGTRCVTGWASEAEGRAAFSPDFPFRMTMACRDDALSQKPVRRLDRAERESLDLAGVSCTLVLHCGIAGAAVRGGSLRCGGVSSVTL
jgi:hypothetical protein